jgi:hypothetical protein
MGQGGFGALEWETYTYLGKYDQVLVEERPSRFIDSTSKPSKIRTLEAHNLNLITRLFRSPPSIICSSSSIYTEPCAPYHPWVEYTISAAEWGPARGAAG